ncbi:hypothetical protein Vadar_001853 [Vaccinium darrowii]|uniref:Uncharacterized protein n=1 Tax=Vaccinium darrowii TaxID=229202 RepID=A0ACB7YB09_9ERIC|nr:hypothetical protein Vadar_001853 [Vaccinium darrowii]
MSKESQSSDHPPEGVIRDGGGGGGGNIVRDVVLWRRKKLSISVLLVATAIWVLLDVYQFNSVTLISWVGMVVVTSAFLWGNILRLLNKEPPDLSGLEISEERAVEMAYKLKSGIEEGIRWMVRVAVEGDCFTFAGTVAALWVLSEVGSYFDLLTLLYTGIVVGMTVPPVYVKYEDKIKGFGERLRMQFKRYYDMVDEKVLSKIRNGIVGERKAENENLSEDTGDCFSCGGLLLDKGISMEKVGLAEKMSHISTGGGAGLELLEGKPLPGVLALDDA